MLADSAQSRRVVLAPGESLHVELSGEGEPVILIPGLFGTAYAFRHVAPLLNAAGFHTIVIEPLGSGGSSRPDRVDYSAGAQASRVAAVLDSLGVQGGLVIAHSAAASVAFRLAFRRPDLVAGTLSLESGPAETLATDG